MLVSEKELAMSNAMIQLTENLTSDQVAFFFGMKAVTERFRRLPDADLADVLELIGSMNKADEDRSEILETIWQIVEGAPLNIQPVEQGPPPAKCSNLQRWTEYVSKKIRELREAKGWTQSQLADAAGLPQSHISRLENGKHSPAHATLRKIASALGVELHLIDPNV